MCLGERSVKRAKPATRTRNISCTMEVEPTWFIRRGVSKHVRRGSSSGAEGSSISTAISRSAGNDRRRREAINDRLPLTRAVETYHGSLRPKLFQLFLRTSGEEGEEAWRNQMTFVSQVPLPHRSYASLYGRISPNRYLRVKLAWRSRVSGVINSFCLCLHV